MIQLNKKTVAEVCCLLAGRVKARRLELNLTQQGLSARADVNIETYRRFERTGEIALVNLVKIALALNMLDDFELLFSKKQYQSIDEILNDKQLPRKRGKKG